MPKPGWRNQGGGNKRQPEVKRGGKDVSQKASPLRRGGLTSKENPKANQPSSQKNDPTAKGMDAADHKKPSDCIPKFPSLNRKNVQAQLRLALENYSTKQPIDAWTAALKAGANPKHPITTAELAKAWVDDNWDLVRFVFFGRLALDPGEQLCYGDWKVIGLSSQERPRFLLPYLQAVGPWTVELADLNESEVHRVLNVLYVRTCGVIQLAIEDFVFRLFNRNVGYGYDRARTLATTDTPDGRRALERIVKVFPEAPLQDSELSQALVKAILVPGFEKRYRKAVGQKPKAEHRMHDFYRPILAFLCFNPRVQKQFHDGRITIFQLMNLLMEAGISLDQVTQETFHRWFKRNFQDHRSSS